jgi:hypothetical protein
VQFLEKVFPEIAKITKEETKNINKYLEKYKND